MKTRKLDIELNGKVIKKDFEVPEFWSDRAALISAEKYATHEENSVLEIINRVVAQISFWGDDQGYFKTPEGNPDGKAFTDFTMNLKDILLNQRAAFNSPVWFNCGVKTNTNQMSGCFILSVKDNLEDIAMQVVRETAIFKSGSGSGGNVSDVRAKGEVLSNKGTASGPVSFMRTWDKNAGSIKAGGRTRRAARLMCMDDNHPDIVEFIECKIKEEDKMRILIEGGIDENEAKSTVDFQNTNHSISVSDDFMVAARDDKKWCLLNRNIAKDPANQIAATVNARDILKKAAHAAWMVGDPGIQFNDRMNLDNPVPSMGNIRSTNPCSEFAAIDNSSCNLASINLIKYYNKDTDVFNWNSFAEDIYIMITAMDILVEAADYPIESVRENTVATRPLGLGFANLGALLMVKGLPYDSVDGRSFAQDITEAMTVYAYEQSINLAKKLGSFKEFENNKEQCIEIAGRLIGYGDITKGIKEYGLRNSQLTLLAPTGTTGFLMDCDTMGVEPLIALKYIKYLVGGGTMEIIPQCIKDALSKLEVKTVANLLPGRTQEELSIINLPKSKQKIFQTALASEHHNDTISWKGHIDMMAACQKYLHGAISKTVNMPSDCTEQDVYDAYMYAWEQGVKAVAVYRDNSKVAQPLSTGKKLEVAITQWSPTRRKLPDTCYGPRHKFNIGGLKGYIKVSTYDDGAPGELFVTASKSGSTMQGLLDAFAISISIALQYGVPVEKLIEKFKDTTFLPAGFTTNEDIRSCSSVIDYIFKWLEFEFIDKDDDDIDVAAEEIQTPIQLQKLPQSTNFDGPPCTNCGAITFRQGSCFLCPSCAETSGCS